MAKSLMNTMGQSKLLLPVRKAVGKVILDGLQSTNRCVIHVSDPIQTAYATKVLRFVRKAKKERDMLLSDSEGYQICQAVHHTAKIKGDVAEVGVFRGGSARLIAEYKGTKTLHLFDTFEGLQDVSEVDSPQFHHGLFATSFEEVKKSLSTYNGIKFYKGYFPKTAGSLSKKRFSFVHLDVDTYESTLNCLKWFYPRMSKGGILISHDYISTTGVRKAFDEFFKDKPEPLVEMLSSQVLISKL